MPTIAALSRTTTRALGALALAAALLPLGGCQVESAVASTTGGRAVGTSGGVSPSAAKGSFTGTDGLAVVAGRSLRAEAGRLSLDGQPHGAVDPRSVAQLFVRNGQAMVMVNGVVRSADASR